SDSTGGHALTFQIRRASLADLRTVAELFDAYRQFYGQAADYPLAEAFLRARFTSDDSVVFLAVDPHTSAGLGFVQLYPSFSSVAARHIWILNDLFVAPAARRSGIGRALLDAARHHGQATGAKRLVLSTAVTNREARALYETYGYTQDDVFLVYKLELQRRTAAPDTTVNARDGQHVITFLVCTRPGPRLGPAGFSAGRGIGPGRAPRSRQAPRIGAPARFAGQRHGPGRDRLRQAAGAEGDACRHQPA